MPIINLRVDADLKAEIDAQAAAEKRTLRAFITRVIELYLAANDGRKAA